jgi:DNA-binding response OmpR family regulator/cytochrome c-type biogenesis protein CcmH/NrfG
MNYSLAGKTLLIIDDYPTMRKAIRDMVYTLEANIKILEADNGEHAISLLQKNAIDIVLCDHNLRVGKNGQQILEEARLSKLLNINSIFIMISAEQSAKLVLGVMDSKPDDYLTKPFNAQQLYQRLNGQFARKTFLKGVEKELERGNLAQAIQNCDQLIATSDKNLQGFLQKLRAELAISVGDFDTAKKIYQEILAFHDLPWAKLGLGIIDFQQNKLESAVWQFEQVIREHPSYLEGYDWLCKAYESLNRLNDEQITLLQAVALAPQSFLRQKKLAEIAEKNGQLELAEKAYKAVLQLGKYSMHKSCSDFSGLAKVYVQNNAAEQALAVLKSMRAAFENQPEAELWAAVIEAELYHKQGETTLVAAAMQKVLAVNLRVGTEFSKELQLDIVHACLLTEHPEKADEILEALITTYIDDEKFLNDIRRLQAGMSREAYSEELISQTKRRVVTINNQGVELYQQGKFSEAIDLFEQARRQLPQNKTILLNMLKIIIHDLCANPVTKEKLLRVKTLMRKAEKLGVDEYKLGQLKMQLATTHH